MIARRLYYFLSPVMRRKVRRLLYLPVDLIETLTGKRHPLAPPRGMIFTGSGDYIASGKQLAEMCITYGGLKPDGRVLDAGCGIGRLAVPLTSYLSPEGSYDGFDVVADGIDWCIRHIGSRFPNFRFRYTPLRNDLYNLDTKNKAEKFEFPYPAETFDLVVLTSVFTHMQYEEVRNYLKQIHRVLKPGGRCLATFFIMDDATQQLIISKPEVMQFDYEYDTHFLHDHQVKDANIAFKLDALERLFAEAGLTTGLLNKGWWRGTGRESSLNYQDVVILKK